MKKLFFILCLIAAQLSANVTIHNHTNMTVDAYRTGKNTPFKTLSPCSTHTITTNNEIALQTKNQWITPVFVKNGEERHLYYEPQYPGSHVCRFVLTEKKKLVGPRKTNE